MPGASPQSGMTESPFAAACPSSFRCSITISVFPPEIGEVAADIDRRASHRRVIVVWDGAHDGRVALQGLPSPP